MNHDLASQHPEAAAVIREWARRIAESVSATIINDVEDLLRDGGRTESSSLPDLDAAMALADARNAKGEGAQ